MGEQARSGAAAGPKFEFRGINHIALVEKDMAQLAEWMRIAIDVREDEAKLAELRAAVTAFATRYPLPSDKA